MNHWDKSAIKKRIREKRLRTRKKKGGQDKTLDLLLVLFIVLSIFLAAVFIIGVTG